MKTQKAFSILTALFIIIIMSTVGVLVFNLSGNTVRSTTEQYQKEQAMLLAKSYTEYAIMAVMSNDRNSTGLDCIEDIDGRIGDDVNNGEGYLIETRIAYIADSEIRIVTCSDTRKLNKAGGTFYPVITPESALNILVDVYVKYKNPDHPDVSNSPWMTYHRRTLQKI